jgi:hypothetical protein
MSEKLLLEKLDRIQQAIEAKGHPMQDFSTLKMAMLDLIDILRKMLACGTSTKRKK